LGGILLFLHIVVCILLIIVILLQSGKSADLAGAFGGAGSQSTFGPRGTATILSKATTVLAVMFMVITLLLMISSKRGMESGKGSSVRDDLKQEQKIDEKNVQKEKSKDQEKEKADTKGKSKENNQEKRPENK